MCEKRHFGRMKMTWCLISLCDIKFQNFYPLLWNTHTIYSRFEMDSCSTELNILPCTLNMWRDSFQLNIDKNQKVILKLVEFYTCFFSLSHFVKALSSKFQYIEMLMANGFVYLTAIVQSPRKKNPLTHIWKLHKRFFVYFFFFSVTLHLPFFVGFCRQHGLMIRDLLLILFHTDYVTNKSRIKINIGCLMCKAYFVVERFYFFLRSPKSSFLSHAFIFFPFLYVFSWNASETVLVEISTRFEYYSKCYMISTKVTIWLAFQVVCD